MKYRKLGKSNLAVSEIGFGTWGIGGISYGPTDDDESVRALQCAFDKGINFYDTSNSYGRSEELIGKALKHVRDEVFIATKVGCLPHTGRVMPQDFSIGHIKQSIEDSLRRLKTDYIDLYQLHSPSTDILCNDEVIGALEDLRKEGKVRAIGASVRSPDDSLIALERFDCVQVNFNMVDQRLLENNLLGLAVHKGVGIIVRTPFVFGFLTGSYTENTTFASDDHRLNWSEEQLRRWAKSSRLFVSLCENCTLAQLALRFCLTYEGVSTVIPGMMKCWEVEENVACSVLGNLTVKELAFIREIYEANTFFVEK